MLLDFELKELVAKYNNSFWLSWYYAIIMWNHYGSVAEATRLNEENRILMERPRKIVNTFEYVGKRTPSKRVENPTKRVAARPPTSQERPVIQNEEEDDGVDIVTAVIAAESILSVFEGDNSSSSSSSDDLSFSDFGGGGDFSGGGAGGDW